MSRPTFFDLPKPEECDRADLAPPGRKGERYPSLLSSRAEAGFRARSVKRQLGRKLPGGRRRQAEALLVELEAVARGETDGSSWASPVYANRKRLNFTGELLKLHRRYPDAVGVTIRSKTWELPFEHLMALRPRSLMKRLRSLLKDRGFRSGEGWGVFGLHGERNKETGLYQVHVHGLVSGAMISACAKLHDLPNFRPKKGEGARVHLKHKRYDNLPFPLTYILQSWWPMRWRSDDPSSRHRKGRRRRLPEDEHARWLLWASELEAADLCLMMGISATTKGLKISLKSATNSTAQKKEKCM